MIKIIILILITLILSQQQCLLKDQLGACLINSCRNLNTSNNICQQCQNKPYKLDSNCTQLNLDLCGQYDIKLNKCILCPQNKILHYSLQFCHNKVQNCLFYNNDGICKLCNLNYQLNSNKICILTNQIKTLIYNKTQLNNIPIQQPIYKCINNKQYYTLINNTCNDNLQYGYCINGDCSNCIPGYYSKIQILTNNSQCLQCSINNCQICQFNETINNTQCKICSNGYYLQDLNKQCMPCNNYGCLTCQKQQFSKAIVCTSCQLNKTLYKGHCFQCQLMYGYDLLDAKCIKCQISNCSRCQFNYSNTNPDTKLQICKVCQQGYYLNLNTCKDLKTQLVNFNILNNQQKLILLQQNIKNTKIQTQFIKQNNQQNSRFLSYSCQQQTDNYVCICKNNINNLLSSYCSQVNNLDIMFDSNFNLTQSNSTSKIIRFISQYQNTFTIVNNYLNDFINYNNNIPNIKKLLTVYQFQDILQAISILYGKQKNQTLKKQILTNLNNIVKYLYNNNVFDDNINLIKGNGYVFKLVPKGFTDSQYQHVIQSSSNDIWYLLLSDKVKTTNFLTPKFFVFSLTLADNTPININNLKIKKTRHTQNIGIPILFINENRNNVTVNQSNSYINVQNFVGNNYQYGQINIIDDQKNYNQFDYQLIQNVFNSFSWLYIVFFIVIYLIFVPICSLVDCCQKRVSHRKRIQTTQQIDDSQKNQQKSQQKVVQINYKQFYPIYNIGNTPRPKRLQKLCLFIVNMQHSVTFLTLLYFNLGGGHQVVAIALIIPGYILTIIMSYITGALFRFLKGRFKYLINLISIGYWIMWVFLMKKMSSSQSQQYWPYLLTFSILFNLLDLIIDALQVLLVYFSLSQSLQQISLFKCLAKWLSLRGYYQYDKLSNQLDY